MISQRIRELRAEKKISQQDLSNQLFVSPQAISKWERDAATPNPEAIAKMAGIFGVSADYLLGLTDQKETPAPMDGDGLSPGLADLIKQIPADRMPEVERYLRFQAKQGEKP